MWWDDFVHQVQWATCCGANKTTDVVVEQKKKWAVESARAPAEFAPAAQAVFDNQRVAGHVLDQCTKGNVTVSSFGPACAPAHVWPPPPKGVAETLGHVVDAPKGLDLTLALDHSDERRASCAPTRHTLSKVLCRILSLVTTQSPEFPEFVSGPPPPAQCLPSLRHHSHRTITNTTAIRNQSSSRTKLSRSIRPLASSTSSANTFRTRMPRLLHNLARARCGGPAPRTLPCNTTCPPPFLWGGRWGLALCLITGAWMDCA